MMIRGYLLRKEGGRGTFTLDQDSRLALVHSALAPQASVTIAEPSDLSKSRQHCSRLQRIEARTLQTNILISTPSHSLECKLQALNI
jgi:hypothetical protein